MNKPLLTLGLIVFSMSLFAQPTNGLVANYTFNNGNANDETANGNDGTVNGATLSNDRFGNASMAYEFDGVDDNINFGDAPEFRMGTNDFCISLWVNYSATQAANIISKRAGSSMNFSQYGLSILNDAQFGGASRKIVSLMRSSASSDRELDAGIQSDAWKHIVLFHDYSDSTSIIVDGVTVDTKTATLNGNYDVSGEPLVVGFSEENSALYYQGQVDDIRIYNRLLTTQEINDLYTEADPMSTDINELQSAFNIKVYPNPVNEQLFVESEVKIDQCWLVDLTGKVVKEVLDINQPINISNTSPGIYFLRLVADNQVITKKVIIK